MKIEPVAEYKIIHITPAPGSTLSTAAMRRNENEKSKALAW